MQIVIMPIHMTSEDGTWNMDVTVRFPWLSMSEWNSFKTDWQALYGTDDVPLQLQTTTGTAPYFPSEAFAFLDERMNLSMCMCLGLYTPTGFMTGYNAISNFVPCIRVNNYSAIMDKPVDLHDDTASVPADYRYIHYVTKNGPFTSHWSTVTDYYTDINTYLRVSGMLCPVAVYGHASGFPESDDYYSLYIYMPFIVSDAPNINLITAADVHTAVFSANNNYKSFRTSLSLLDSTIAGINKSEFARLLTLSEVKTFESGDTTDPYDQGGNSGGGGGGGTFDNTSDYTPIPPLPTISVADSGMVTLFNPSQAQIRNLSNYLWSDAFDLDAVKKLFADPMDALIGLSIVPVAIPNGSVKTVRVAGVSTGIGMTTAGAQYVAVDCGSITVPETWGAYLDYDPYTKFDIYLPYIGVHALAADDIMGKTVHVVYHVDILTGACVAYVAVNGNVLYSFSGQCAIEIPITSASWSSAIGGAITIAGAIGKMAATGGASAPSDLMTIANAAVNQFKPSIEKSGAISGGAGIMGIQRPYLIKTQPRQALPARQNTYTGYPSHITESLGTLTGYTVVDQIHLNGIPCTDAERDEILSLLKTGVIF